MLMIVGNLQPPKHVTDMADNTIKTTPKDSYGPIVMSGTCLGASHELLVTFQHASLKSPGSAGFRGRKHMGNFARSLGLARVTPVVGGYGFGSPHSLAGAIPVISSDPWIARRGAQHGRSS